MGFCFWFCKEEFFYILIGADGNPLDRRAGGATPQGGPKVEYQAVTTACL